MIFLSCSPKLTTTAIIYTVVPATRGHCRFGAKVSPRGRWSLVAGIDILTHRSTGTRLLHIIVYALLNAYTKVKTGMYQGNENREIASTYITTCSIVGHTGYQYTTVHGINRHNKSTIVCKCSANLFQTNVTHLYKTSHMSQKT